MGLMCPFVLVPAYPGYPGVKGRKTVAVIVVVNSADIFLPQL